MTPLRLMFQFYTVETEKSVKLLIARMPETGRCGELLIRLTGYTSAARQPEIIKLPRL
jgi:hypothetical protein